MSNSVPFQSQEGMPALFQEMFGEVGLSDDLIANVGMGFAYLSIKGKTFKIVNGDAEDVLFSADGSGMPAQYLDIVVLKASRDMSKTYYLSGFAEDSHSPPDCASMNSIVPDPGVPAPQARSCAECEWNQWGSRVSTDPGMESKGKACQDARRTAIVRLGAIDDPLLVRIPPTSLKGLAEYGHTLSKRGVPYQAVITRIHFDHTVAYPKLMFQAVRYLSPEEAESIRDLIGSPGQGIAPDPIIEQICGIVPVRAAPQPPQPIAGQLPQQFAGQPVQPMVQQPQQQARPNPPQQPQQQPPQQVQQHVAQPVAQGQPYVPPTGGMFDTPQQPRQTVQQQVPQQTAQQPAAPTTRTTRKKKTDPVPEQTAGVMPNGAAHAGVTVVDGDDAQGLDALLGGFPDVPGV